MAKCYFELRKQAARGTNCLSADIMRHLHARQHLGRAMIISQHPSANVGSARKQWLKLSRTIQAQRARTLNADKILKFTHSIICMQNMRFSHKTPLAEPEADVYFLKPQELGATPASCYTVYLTEKLDAAARQGMVAQLPAEALVVDYSRENDWEALGLQPKKVLEEQLETEWKQIHQFLVLRDIEINNLLDERFGQTNALDDALDILMICPNKFLIVADEFHHALELARPLRIGKDLRRYYDIVMLLAHRVQTLSSAGFSKQFLESYNEDDTFFLYDRARKRFITSGETLAELINRHREAGRLHLAAALQAIA